ncbi:hypothetical protein [Actinoplanes sp. M2I2]|nr:hypothetical protein [Actinoplanes sp. M2I2]
MNAASDAESSAGRLSDKLTAGSKVAAGSVITAKVKKCSDS